MFDITANFSLFIYLFFFIEIPTYFSFYLSIVTLVNKTANYAERRLKINFD